MYVTEAARSKGKGKARELSLEVPAPDPDEDSEQAEHMPEELLSPEVPPSPLPDDDFEDKMSVDVEIIDSEPAHSPPTAVSGGRAGLRTQAKSKSARLDTSQQLKFGQRYFVGKRPPPYPIPSQKVDKGKGRKADTQVRWSPVHCDHR